MIELITGAIKPTISPSFVHLGTVKQRLSKLVINTIVKLA